MSSSVSFGGAPNEAPGMVNVAGKYRGHDDEHAHGTQPHEVHGNQVTYTAAFLAGALMRPMAAISAAKNTAHPDPPR